MSNSVNQSHGGAPAIEIDNTVAARLSALLSGIHRDLIALKTSQFEAGETARLIDAAEAKTEQARLLVEMTTDNPRGANNTAATPSNSGARLLVMDDEDSIRTMAQKLLTTFGYRVNVAVDGTEALSRYREAMASGDPFDVVILDLTIATGMGGEEAMMRLLKINPDIKAIAASGYFNAPVMTKFRDYGFANVIVKPYTLSELKNAISDVL